MASDVARKLAVLAYHKIGPVSEGGWETWNYVKAAAFESQIESVRALGYEFVSKDQVLRGLADPASLPARAALMTFDDAYASLLDHAVPILERLEIPSVVFVPLAFISGTNRFDDGVEPKEAICSPEQLRELERRGVAVESHSVNHRAFSTLTSDERARELGESRERLSEILRRDVRMFAYPYGDAGGEDAEELVAAAGYDAAFLYKGGVLSLPTTIRGRLPRVAMGPDTFLAKHLGGVR